MEEVAVRLKVPERVWEEFAAYARRRRRKPESLAEQVFREAVQWLIDEQLDTEMRRAACRTQIREEDVVDLIRQWRRARILTSDNQSPNRRIYRH